MTSPTAPSHGPDAVAPGSDRRAELAVRLAAVRARVSEACRQAGRHDEDVTLVVVTKTHPASDVALLASLGVRDVGENRDQEAAAKHSECAGLDLRWHFIGRLQSNKARSVARYADMVHSVDRPALVGALDRGAHAAGRRLDCLVQVSLDGDTERGGVAVDGFDALAAAVADAASLRLRGVMAVAPLGADPARAFAALPGLLERGARYAPEADVLSAGMSGDLEAAVASGATHLRVGTAILGARPTLR
jgi:pyridoxal phosphate enzyme (YggS family)